MRLKNSLILERGQEDRAGTVTDKQIMRRHRKLVGNGPATTMLLLRGLRQDGDTGSSGFFFQSIATSIDISLGIRV